MLLADNNIKNLGSIKFGEPKHFTFTLTNTYHTLVSVEKLVIGCTSCTKAVIDKWDLQPEETAVISVTFTPGSLGLQSKTLSVIHATGSTERPALELKIKANVHE